MRPPPTAVRDYIGRGCSAVNRGPGVSAGYSVHVVMMYFICNVSAVSDIGTPDALLMMCINRVRSGRMHPEMRLYLCTSHLHGSRLDSYL